MIKQRQGIKNSNENYDLFLLLNRLRLSCRVSGLVLVPRPSDTLLFLPTSPSILSHVSCDCYSLAIIQLILSGQLRSVYKWLLKQSNKANFLKDAHFQRIPFARLLTKRPSTKPKGPGHRVITSLISAQVIASRFLFLAYFVFKNMGCK